MKQTIQIADKPTLDEVKSLLENSGYGLEELKLLLDTVNLNVDSVKTVTKRTGIYGKINALDSKFKYIKVSKGSSGTIEIPGKIIPMIGYCVRVDNIPNTYNCVVDVTAKESSGKNHSNTNTACSIGFTDDNYINGLDPFIYNTALNRSFDRVKATVGTLGIYFNIPANISGYSLRGFSTIIHDNEYLKDTIIQVSNPQIDTYCYFHYIELGE